MKTTTQQIISWILRLLAAILMLQTLFFKFTAAPESVYIFSTLKMEPWGRLLTGIAELVASILILYPSTIAFGALLGLGIMSGAMLSHLLVLGIEIQGDGGQLFLYAVLVWISCLMLLLLHKQVLLQILHKWRKAE
ncbi:MAG: DoxX family protein [Chitinophagaceae bacterium]|nr:DoxX family protein [Chitinophagaceae bacterium]